MCTTKSLLEIDRSSMGFKLGEEMQTITSASMSSNR